MRARRLRGHDPPIGSLAAAVLGHWRSVEADFARFYSIDLAAALWGPEPISFRRLEALVLELPLESRTARALGAAAPGKWSNVEELLATMLELLDDQRRLFVAANTDPKKGRPQMKPLRVPRPGDQVEENRRRPATGEELARFLGNRGTVRYHPKEVEPSG